VAQKRHISAETIYSEALRLATSERNMYFTYLELKANGEDHTPTAVEAMIHYLRHGGYKETLESLGVEEYPFTTSTPSQERAQKVHSD
jgi:hypothetical protein